MSERKSKKEGRSRKHRRDYSTSRSRSNSKASDSSSRSVSSEKRKKSSHSKSHHHTRDSEGSSHRHKQKQSSYNPPTKKSSTTTPLKSAQKEQTSLPSSAQATPKGSSSGTNGFGAGMGMTHPMFNQMFPFPYGPGMMGMPYDVFQAGGSYSMKGSRGMKYPGAWNASGSQGSGNSPKNEGETETAGLEKKLGDSKSQESGAGDQTAGSHSYFPSRRGHYGRGYFGRGSHQGENFYKNGYSGYGRSMGGASRMMAGMAQEYYQQIWASMGANAYGAGMMGAPFGMENYESMMAKFGKEEEKETMGEKGGSKEEDLEKEKEEKNKLVLDEEAQTTSKLKEFKQRNRTLEKVGWIETLPPELLENRELLPLIGTKALKFLHQATQEIEEAHPDSLNKAYKSIRSIEKRLRSSFLESDTIEGMQIEPKSKEKEEIPEDKKDSSFGCLGFRTLKCSQEAPVCEETQVNGHSKETDTKREKEPSILKGSNAETEVPEPVDGAQNEDSLARAELLMQSIKLL